MTLTVLSSVCAYGYTASMISFISLGLRSAYLNRTEDMKSDLITSTFICGFKLDAALIFSLNSHNHVRLLETFFTILHASHRSPGHPESMDEICF